MDQEPSELEKATSLLAELQRTNQQRIDVESEVKVILSKIEEDLRAILDVRHWLTGFEEHCERQESMARIVWACYHMLQILTNWIALQEPKKRQKELEDFRKVIEASGLEDRISEIHVEQIQVSGEADDTPETGAKKRKRKK